VTTIEERTEAAVLDEVAADLEDAGYTVLMRPSRQLIPDFLRAIEPDAVAIGRDPKLVIEVTREGPRSAEKVKRIQRLLEGHPEWQLKVFLDRTERATVGSASAEQIHATLDNVRDLSTRGDVRAAMLLAWATFEALARHLEPTKFERPQTPGRLVEVLASLGHVVPSEADKIRALVPVRNSLIHGDFSASVSAADVNHFVEILEDLSASI
jgi:uncharacterized protein YutE (UPF0331/DUF86 family)